MKSRTFTAGMLTALIAAFVATSGALAHGDGTDDMTPGYGMGPGMMGDYSMGPGMMPGMMGGYGMNHGMMPGMTGDQVMGPGMMGGQGMGPGMIGGQGMMPGMTGDHGMGPGMMRGGAPYGVELSSGQRKQMARIGTELRKHVWSLQGEMIDARGELLQLYADETPDAKKIGAVYGKIFDLRRQMIEAAIDARNRQRAVLTEEQRERLQEGLYGRPQKQHDSDHGRAGSQHRQPMMGG